MGCVSSTADDKDLDSDDKKKKQRRRLSVDPKHVNSGGKDDGGSAEANGKANGTEMAKKDGKEAGGGDVEGVDPTSWTEAERAVASKTNWAVESRKGVVPYNRNKVNQDRAMLKWALRGDDAMTLFGVMDGHGEFGHFVASFVQEKLPVNLVAQAELKAKTVTSILAAVETTCKQLTKAGINCAFSGTTCVFGVRVEDRLFVANIGDSRCVMCRQTKEGDNYVCVPLSADQKPDVPAEKKRILEHGGRVEPLPGPPGEDCGPPRVWLPEVDVPGLAMSRSIGDEISQRVGVISVPEIVEHKIVGNDIFAIWASDGVWEFLSNEQACDIVWKNRSNLQVAAQVLALEASKRWKQEEEVVDDITCVIIGFNDAK